MNVTEVTWVAHQVPTEVLVEARTLAEALGLSVLGSSDAHLMLQMGRGDMVEYCTRAHPVTDYLFEEYGTVIGFRVNSLQAAADQLRASGFQSISPVQALGPSPTSVSAAGPSHPRPDRNRHVTQRPLTEVSIPPGAWTCQ